MRSLSSSRGSAIGFARPVAVALAVAAGDLATKWLAERRLDEPVALLAGVRLQLGHNSGVAFGALNDLPAGVLIAGVTLFVLGLTVAAVRGMLPVPWQAVGLLLGGASANLVDRAGDGRVTDFIDPPRWPAFNVADIAISCAVLLMFWHSWRGDRSAERRAPVAADRRVRVP